MRSAEMTGATAVAAAKTKAAKSWCMIVASPPGCNLVADAFQDPRADVRFRPWSPFPTP